MQLRRRGARVFGIGDAAHENLDRDLREALSDYCRVDTLEDDQQVFHAGKYLSERYGAIDRIASHNEHWLELEARFRERFDVPGRKVAETAEVRRKSLMKARFARAGIEVAPGILVRSQEDAETFAATVGFPLVAKPDRGVGASETYRLASEEDLRVFFGSKPPVDYFLEAYVAGKIVTFDGLVDGRGDIVFSMSLEYSRNIMEVVSADDHVYYFTLRDLPSDLVRTGMAAVGAFELREQFFHFEFFRTPEGRLLGLEINARPPGWPTTDMFNYANDADAYREWANVITGRSGEYEWRRKYHCIFVGRKHRMGYRHSHEAVLARYAGCIVATFRIPGIFGRAMGDYAYIARSPRLDELLSLASFAQLREPG